jgi:hypothetical protein
MLGTPRDRTIVGMCNPDQSKQPFSTMLCVMASTKLLPSKLSKAPQPPLSQIGSTADSDRARRPALSEPDNREEKETGDRVESLGDFGKATGEIGTVKETNNDDAVVKWDDDGQTRRRQSSLKKV